MTYHKYVLGIDSKIALEASEKLHSERTQKEKQAITFIRLNTLSFFIALPYILYQLFVNPSIPAVVALATQIMYNSTKNKAIRIACDIAFMACLFWLWFIVYN